MKAGFVAQIAFFSLCSTTTISIDGSIKRIQAGCWDAITKEQHIATGSGTPPTGFGRTIMLDGLNKFGLPAKYGIVGFVAGIPGSFLAQMLNVHDGDVSSYLATMIATGIGGSIGGWFRERRGMTS